MDIHDDIYIHNLVVEIDAYQQKVVFIFMLKIMRKRLVPLLILMRLLWRLKSLKRAIVYRDSLGIVTMKKMRPKSNIEAVISDSEDTSQRYLDSDLEY